MSFSAEFIRPMGQKEGAGPTFVVVQEITESQLDELITYSHQDAAVGMFTSDAERFSSQAAFKEWEKTRKIYVLTDP